MKKLVLSFLTALALCATPALAYNQPQTATAPITLSASNVIACPTCLTGSNGVSSFTAGTTGLTPSTATTGAVTLGGTLNGANGGTGVSNSGKTITLGGNLTTSGAFNSTFTMTAATGVTFPTSGTLATTSQLAFSNLTGQATNAQLATQTANTVLGALTATTPSGLAVPSCSSATNALTWTSGTGFGCNTFAVGGSVTSVSVTTANGVSGSVTNPTTTPAISLTLGAITPSSVAATGALSGTSLTDSGLSTAGIVTNNSSGLLATSTALPSGTTATTQSPGNNSTPVATTAYSDQTILLGQNNAVFANLTTAGTSVSFTANELTLGSALGGAGIKIGNYSQTLNISTTGAGGMDTGSAPTSGFLAIYAIQGSSGTSILGVNAITSSGTIYSGTHLPSGYTNSALIAIWPTNSTPQLIIGAVFNRQFSYTNSYTQQILSNGSGGGSGALASISLSSYVPTNAKMAFGTEACGGTSSGGQIVMASSTTGLFAEMQGAGGAAICGDGWWSLPLLTAQTIYYWANGGSYNMYLSGYGW